jgi:hypothetical protein
VKHSTNETRRFDRILPNVTARTNASNVKLERMLYYKDTKLRRRKRGRQDRRRQYRPAAMALVVSEPIVGLAEYGSIAAEFGR